VPSRKIIPIILACILVIGGIYWTTNKDRWETKRQIARNMAIVKTNSLPVNDADQDGLTDWEEVLWKTNPNNKDSDNDGETDGDEVRSGKNPAQPGAGTVEPTTSIAQGGDSAGTRVDASGNITSQVARTVFEEYVTQKQEGGVQQLDFNSLIGEILEGNDGFITPKLYSTSDIRTVTATEANVRGYGNSFAQIVTQFPDLYTAQIQAHFTINAAEEQIIADKPWFSELSRKYSTIVEQLLRLEVPQAFAGKHIEAINTLASIGQSLSDMANVELDAVRGIRGMERYSNLWASQTVIYKDMAAIFTKNGIIFSSSEPGNAWNTFR
jgi:hypothetical protein